MNSKAIRKMPLFPFIPLIPMGVMIMGAISLVILFRRVNALEARVY